MRPLGALDPTHREVSFDPTEDFSPARAQTEDLETFGWRSKMSVRGSNVRVRQETTPAPPHEREVSFSCHAKPPWRHPPDDGSSVRDGSSFGRCPPGDGSSFGSSFGATGDVSFARKGATPYFPTDSFRQRRDALPQSFSYRPDIDGLRAVAVTAVLLFHVDESWLPGGFVGVDVFFVISGYVVAGSLLGRAAATSTSEYLAAFYARRVKRLSPALVAVTCTMALMLAMFVDPSTEALPSYFDSGMLGLVGWANNYFATIGGGARRRRLGNNYFAPPPDAVGDRPPAEISESELKLNPFLHFWSLGVEEQFYLVFPLLVLVAFAERVVVASRPTSPATSFNGVLAMADKTPSPKKDAARAPLTNLGGRRLLWGTMLVGIGISGWMTHSYPQLAFYLLPPRLWELLAGAVLFDLRAGGAGWQWLPDDSCGTCAIVALDLVSWLTILLALVYTRDEENFPFPWSLLSVAGTLSFTAAGWVTPRKVRIGDFQLPTPLFNALCSHPACMYVGRLSYPLYLWHWPLIVLFRHTCGMAPGGNKAAVIVASIGAAVLTYHGLEVQLRRWKPRKHWHVFAVMVPVLGLAELWLGLLRSPLAGKLYVLERSTVPALPSRHFQLQPMGMECPHCISAGALTGPDANGFYPLRGSVPLTGSLTCSCVAPTAANAFPSRYTPPCFLCVNPLCQGDAGNDYTVPLDTPSTWRNFNPNAVKDNMHELYYTPCALDYTDRNVATVTYGCLVPQRVWGASRTVFMIGDSHGASIVPGLMTAVAGAARVVWIAITWELLVFASIGEYEGNGVYEAIDRALNDHVRKGDVIVFMQAAYRFSEHCLEGCGDGGLGDALHSGRPVNAEAAEVSRAVTETYLRRLQRMADPRGAKILLMGDWGLRPCNWNWDGWKQRCNIGWEENNRLYLDKINPTYRRLAGSLPGVSFMDTNDILCPAEGGPKGVCSNFVPGPEPGTVGEVSALHDDDHLSHAGSMYLWPHFCGFFGLLGWPTA